MAVAAALRAFRLGWGLPGYVFPDGFVLMIRPAARLAVFGELFPAQPIPFTHPPVFIYALGIVYFLWSAVTGTRIDAANPRLGATLPTLVLLGRGLEVVVTTLSVVVLYLIARRLAGTRAALFAAAALALAPLPVLESHRVNPDGAMVLVSLLAVHLVVAARDRRRPGQLLGAFALAGLASATKYSGLAIVTVPMWIAWRWEGIGMSARLRLLALGALATLLGFGLGMASAATDPRAVLHGMAALAQGGFSVPQPGYALLGPSWTNVRYLYPLLVALPFMLGWAVYLTALPGLVALPRVLPRAAGPVLAAVIPFFLVQGGSLLSVPRYYLPAAPFLTLAAGVSVDAVWRRHRRLGAGLAALVLGYTALLTGSQCARLGLGPQRAVGKLLAAHAEAATAAGKTLVVGYPDGLALYYDPVQVELPPAAKVVFVPPLYRNVRLDPAEDLADGELLARDRAWVAETGVEAVVLPSWVENAIVRERPDGYAARFYRRLESGELGLHLVANPHSRFFTQALYTWGDPMLDAHWEAGIAGYKVFARDGGGG